MIGQLVAAVRRPAFLLGRKRRETAMEVAPLPWHVGDFLERESCMIFDAMGRHIATVDEWASMPDEDALAIAARIVAAVNTPGARRPVASPSVTTKSMLEDDRSRPLPTPVYEIWCPLRRGMDRQKGRG